VGALLQHKVLVFREQPITAKQHVEFARRFGNLESTPTFPPVDGEKELVRLLADAHQSRRENIFHSDMTFQRQLPLGSVLRCVESPDCGGDTIWSLPSMVKAAIEGLVAAHDLLPNHAHKSAVEREDLRARYPAAEHPVVMVHPLTCQKVLFVNQAFTTHLVNYETKIEGRRGREFKLDSNSLLRTCWAWRRSRSTRCA
jgi:taurine dioxygenase